MKRIWNYITQDDFPVNTWGAILFIAVNVGAIIYYTLKGY